MSRATAPASSVTTSAATRDASWSSASCEVEGAAGAPMARAGIRVFLVDAVELEVARDDQLDYTSRILQL
jgi:hypothetical protein